MTQTNIKLVSEADITELKTLKGQHVLIERWFNSLASAPEVAGDYDEDAAKRFRAILSMLGIGAPESDEQMMLCQFSLLGMMRHKIQQIYNQPDRTAQLEAQIWELVLAADSTVNLIDAVMPSHITEVEMMKLNVEYHRLVAVCDKARSLVNKNHIGMPELLDEANSAKIRMLENENAQLEADNKRLVKALKEIISLEHIPSNFGVARTICRSLLAEMEAKE